MTRFSLTFLGFFASAPTFPSNLFFPDNWSRFSLLIAILCNGSYSMQWQLFYVADWPLAVQHVGDMSLGDVVVLAAVPVVLVLADETRVVPGVGRAAVVDYWVQWVSATDTQTRYLGAVQPFCLLGMSALCDCRILRILPHFRIFQQSAYIAYFFASTGIFNGNFNIFCVSVTYFYYISLPRPDFCQ